MVRAIDEYFVRGEGKVVGGAVGEQLVALSQGKTPNAEYRDYVDALREYKSELEPLAIAMGYASVDGLLASDVGLPLKMRYQQLETELRKRSRQGPRWPTSSRTASSSAGVRSPTSPRSPTARRPRKRSSTSPRKS